MIADIVDVDTLANGKCTCNDESLSLAFQRSHKRQRDESRVKVEMMKKMKKRKEINENVYMFACIYLPWIDRIQPWRLFRLIG